MKSPVGQYLDRHPVLALSILVFMAMSAVPVGFFLLLVVLSTLAALVGVILLEGTLLSYWKLTTALTGHLPFVSKVLIPK